MKYASSSEGEWKYCLIEPRKSVDSIMRRALEISQEETHEMQMHTNFSKYLSHIFFTH